MAVGAAICAQRFDGAFGAIFLHEAQQHRKQHDDGDDDGFDAVPQQGRQHHGHQQDQDQHVLELFQQQRPRRDALRGLQFVRAVFRQSPRRFGWVQAVLEMRVQLPGEVCRFQRVPRRGGLNGGRWCVLLDRVV